MLQFPSTARCAPYSEIAYTRVFTGCNPSSGLPSNSWALLKCILPFEEDTQHSTYVSFLAIQLSGSCSCFAIDCSSYVSLHLHLFFTIISTHQALIHLDSTAIWKRNKVAVMVSIGVWLMNIGFLIQGRSRLLSLSPTIGSRNCCLATGAAHVGDQFQLF